MVIPSDVSFGMHRFEGLIFDKELVAASHRSVGIIGNALDNIKALDHWNGY